MPEYTLHLGDCLAVLPTLEAGSVDAVVTDPPAGIGFMPFAGSCSTGKAAVLEGYGFVGIEQNPDYHATAQRRLDAARAEADTAAPLFRGAD